MTQKKKQTEETVEELEETMTLELRKPIEMGKHQSLTALNLEEPTADQVDQFTREQARKGHMSAGILLIALVSCEPVAAVKQIGMRDFKIASEFLISFMSDGQETGDNS